MLSMQKPYLPSCFLSWTEPPDEAGDEVFRLASWRRTLALKGHSFRTFGRRVVPLLDGRHTFDQIATEVGDVFDRDDLAGALETLASQGIVVEGEGPEADLPDRLAPQLNYLSETAPEGRAAQRRLGAASVAVFGLGGAGAGLARALAAAGVGRMVLADPHPVDPANAYFSALFAPSDAGRARTQAAAERIRATAPEIHVEAMTDPLDDHAAIAASLDGVDIAVSCLESGDLNGTFKLHRAARQAGIRFLAGSQEGTEIIAGPGCLPEGDGPCYMCYRMRSVACAANPQSRFALERQFDRMKTDLSGRRENLAFGASILAGLLGAEIFNCLARTGEPVLDGRLIAVDLVTLRQEKHVVLKKPGCPVCSEEPAQ